VLLRSESQSPRRPPAGCPPADCPPAVFIPPADCPPTSCPPTVSITSYTTLSVFRYQAGRASSPVRVNARVVIQFQQFKGGGGRSRERQGSGGTTPCVENLRQWWHARGVPPERDSSYSVSSTINSCLMISCTGLQKNGQTT
jgi:hypothetical protein